MHFTRNCALAWCTQHGLAAGGQVDITLVPAQPLTRGGAGVLTAGRMWVAADAMKHAAAKRRHMAQNRFGVRLARNAPGFRGKKKNAQPLPRESRCVVGRPQILARNRVLAWRVLWNRAISWSVAHSFSKSNRDRYPPHLQKQGRHLSSRWKNPLRQKDGGAFVSNLLCFST